MKEKMRLSDHFTYRRLFRFALPSVAMMIFTSIYGVVDGIWLSIAVAELCAALVTVLCLVKYKKRYRY